MRRSVFFFGVNVGFPKHFPSPPPEWKSLIEKKKNLNLKMTSSNGLTTGLGGKCVRNPPIAEGQQGQSDEFL